MKIGFEFETAIPKMGWGEKATIFQAALVSSVPDVPKAWKAVNDLGLEFVTQPFPATDIGLRALNLTMADIERVLAEYEIVSDVLLDDLIERGVPEAKYPERYMLDAGLLARIDRIEVQPHLHEPHGVGGYDPGQVSANPQMTVGLTLDRIADVIGDLPKLDLAGQIGDRAIPGDGSLLGDTTLIGAVPPTAKAVTEARRLAVTEARSLRTHKMSPDPAAYGHYAGFLTIVLSYILTGMKQGREWDYPKVIAPAMSRVPVSDLLGNAVHASLRHTFTWDNIRALLDDGGHPIDDRTLLFPKGAEGVVGLTVKAWVESIARGATTGELDILSDSEPSMKGYRVAQLDRAGDDPIVLLELRYLPRQVRPGDWAPVARQLFAWARDWGTRPPVDLDT